jgi:hypothetical protein
MTPIWSPSSSAAQPLDYLNGVGQSVLQGLQQLKMYVFCGFLYHISAALSNYVAINLLHYGINGSATVHVMRQFMMIGLVRPTACRSPTRCARSACINS